MAVKTWVLCDPAGQPMTEVANAVQAQFTARRNLGRQATLTLTHQEVEAALLLAALSDGVPQLRYYRDGVLRLSAYLTSIGQRISDNEDSLVATFKDPFGRLFGDGSGSGRILTSPLVFTGQDQGSIGWQLIAALNGVADTGIRQGATPATVTRDRAYEAGKNVGEALVQLTEVDGGPDIEFLPLDPITQSGKLAEYVVYASQGVAKSDLLWGYGPGTMANVLDVERLVAPPVNMVRLTTTGGLVSVQTDAASIALYGEWPLSASEPNDVTDQATLDAKAMALLHPGWTTVVKFTPDPDQSPHPFDDYWLGDTGQFRGTDGAFDESFLPRVNAITITEGPDGVETHEIELQEDG